ncbi:MAG: hypothetical protein AAFW84_02680 [Cyanobacteria bacterium J06635_15]
MLAIARLTTLLISLSFLVACTTPPDSDATVSSPTLSAPIVNPSTVTTEPNVTDVEFERLPDAIATQVKAQLSEEIGDTSLQIGRYSRETWSDGCLGLGGPAESCLAALTEGWQVEVTDTTNQSYFYRTDLSGNSIRRSTLAHNLPPSLRDRIFQTVIDNGLADVEDLTVTAAEPRLWDGCYGIPQIDGNCPAIGILGWHTIISDGDQSWVYHTNNSGSVIQLKD